MGLLGDFLTEFIRLVRYSRKTCLTQKQVPSEALTRCLIAAGVDTPPPKKAKKKEDLPAEGVEVWDRLGKAG